MPAPLVSIVIPAYNEATRLPATLGRIGAWLAVSGVDAEILIVDDGSSDGTGDLVEMAARTGFVPVEAPARPAVGAARSGPAVRTEGRVPAGRLRLVRNPGNRGKGYSFRHGVREARGIWVLFTDADLSTPIEDFDRLYARARDGNFDIVIGSRALAESNITLYQPFYRVWMGRTFNRMVRLIAGLPFRDTQCGFKLMVRERVLPLVERMIVDRFAYDVELLLLAHRTGLTIAEVPVTWHNSPVSKVGLLRDPMNMLRDIWRVRRRFDRGEYRRADEAEGQKATGS